MMRNRQVGFSLIEVLIAVVIGAVGIMAIVQLNLNNVRATRAAYLQSIAANYARDMGERIQANKAAISKLGVSAYDLPTAASTAACRTPGGGCTAAQMAAHDYWEWQNAISGNASVIQPEAGVIPTSLPGGAGQVCVDSDGTIASTTSTLSAAVCDQDGLTNAVTHVIGVHWTELGNSRALDYVIRINPSHEKGY